MILELGAIKSYLILHDSVLGTLLYVNDYTNKITMYKISSQSLFKINIHMRTELYDFHLYHIFTATAKNYLKVDWVHSLISVNRLPIYINVI
jgi:hypothetical protein